MNVLSEIEEESVKALVEKFSVEDIWTIECAAARECGLETDLNFVVIVPGGQDVLNDEYEALKMLRAKFPGRTPGVFFFQQSAIERTPRPLLVKMALTSGRKIFGQ